MKVDSGNRSKISDFYSGISIVLYVYNKKFLEVNIMLRFTVNNLTIYRHFDIVLCSIMLMIQTELYKKAEIFLFSPHFYFCNCIVTSIHFKLDKSLRPVGSCKSGILHLLVNIIVGSRFNSGVIF